MPNRGQDQGNSSQQIGRNPGQFSPDDDETVESEENLLEQGQDQDADGSTRRAGSTDEDTPIGQDDADEELEGEDDDDDDEDEIEGQTGM